MPPPPPNRGAGGFRASRQRAVCVPRRGCWGGGLSRGALGRAFRFDWERSLSEGGEGGGRGEAVRVRPGSTQAAPCAGQGGPGMAHGGWGTRARTHGKWPDSGPPRGRGGHAAAVSRMGKPRRSLRQCLSLRPGSKGRGGCRLCVLFSSAAGGPYWLITIHCPSLGPFSSRGFGACRPLTTLCPSSSSLV